jgi:hypothetical protein
VHLFIFLSVPLSSIERMKLGGLGVIDSILLNDSCGGGDNGRLLGGSGDMGIYDNGVAFLVGVRVHC